MKKLNFVFFCLFFIGAMSQIFASNYSIRDKDLSDNCPPPPPPYSYNLTVIIGGSDCPALSNCNLEVVIYRWTGSGNPQAIDRTPYVYGTSSYYFTESIDPGTYPYVIAKIVDQPGTPCGYSYNQSGYVYINISGTTGGSYTFPSLTPCY
jgi:hypothetical protein